MGETSPKAIEYILAQECIDKGILKSQDHLNCGIGCACSANNKYTCYFVSAKRVRAKEITE